MRRDFSRVNIQKHNREHKLQAPEIQYKFKLKKEEERNANSL